MSMKARKSDPKFLLAYDRGMLRSAFKSLFWGIISEKKKQSGGFTLKNLAQDTSTSKHEVSRWFSGDPNWTINTVANLANALNVELRISAIDRSTGVVFTPSGIQNPSHEKKISTETFMPMVTVRATAGKFNMNPTTSAEPMQSRVAA